MQDPAQQARHQQFRPVQIPRNELQRPVRIDQVDAEARSLHEQMIEPDERGHVDASGIGRTESDDGRQPVGAADDQDRQQYDEREPVGARPGRASEPVSRPTRV